MIQYDVFARYQIIKQKLKFYNKMQTINTFLSLISKTEGRDKVLRLFQYTCLHALEHKEKGTRFRIYEQMRMTRKLLRFLRTLDFLYRIKAEIPIMIQNYRFKPQFLRHLMNIMQNIFTFLFYITDHWICLSELGVLSEENLVVQFPRSMKFWFFQNIFGVLHDICCMVVSIIKSKDHKDVKKLIRAIKHYSFDLIRCSLDMLVSLFYMKKAFSPKTAGIIGVISSIMAIMQLLQKHE